MLNFHLHTHLLPILSLPQKTAFIPRFSIAIFLYLYFLMLLIFSNKNSLICIPHELCRAPAARTGYRHRNGRYRKLLRGIVRVSGRQVHQLHGGTPHHDEPVSYPQGRDERGKDRLPKESCPADLEGHAGNSHEDGRPSGGKCNHRLLRCVFQRLRRLHAHAAGRPEKKPRHRRTQP